MTALGTLDVPLYARGAQVGRITVPLSAHPDPESNGDGTATVRIRTGTPTVVLPLTACQRCATGGIEVEVHGTVAGRSHLVGTFTACPDCRPDLFPMGGD